MHSETHIRFFFGAVLAFVLLVMGCTRNIPPEALTDVDQGITFQDLRQNPEAFTGKTVLLGGTVISAENAPRETTIMILQHSLDSDLKPLNTDQSAGRFLVVVPEFLDPAIYAKGRKITVVGNVSGKETRPLNDVPYVYPVLQNRFLHLWPQEAAVDAQPRVYFGIGIGFGNYHYR